MQDTKVSAGGPSNFDGFSRYESQPEQAPSSDSDDEYVNQDPEDYTDYKVGRRLGLKADPVKEQVASVKMDAPYVPQQINEKSFNELTLELQTKTTKKFKNLNFRYNEQNMTANGLLNVDENGVPVLRNEMSALLETAKHKMPEMAEAIEIFTQALDAATAYPEDLSVDPDAYACKCQGLVLLKEWLEKLIRFRNVQHAYKEFVKIVKLYEKSKAEKKIAAEMKNISMLQEDIEGWQERKSETNDKDLKEILSRRIQDAKKAIEGHQSKMEKLQERETLRRSLRLQQSPRSTSKSPTPPDAKRQRTDDGPQ